MRMTPLALALLMASPAFAQTAMQSGKNVTPQVNGPAQTITPDAQRRLQEQVAKARAKLQAESAACPVGFSANRRGSAGLEVTKPGDTHTGMGLDLGFHATVRAIVEADITVHGTPLGAQALAVPMSAPQEAAEDFVLKGTADDPVKPSSIWMRQLSTVSWVELTRVVFADGGEWTPSGPRCIVRPSMLVLVNSSTR